MSFPSPPELSQLESLKSVTVSGEVASSSATQRWPSLSGTIVILLVALLISTSSVAQQSVNTGLPLGPFRAAQHSDFTRIAVDLSDLEVSSIAVGPNSFVVSFNTTSASVATWTLQDPRIENARYTMVHDRVALIVNTRYPLSADGTGYRTGRTDSGTFYIDFAPHLRGQPEAELTVELPDAVGDSGDSLSTPEPESRQTSGTGRRIVVIDPGHSGIDPGAVGYAIEHEVALAVSLRVKTILEAANIEVILTRDGNYHLDSVKSRDLAMRADFATPDRNLFVSIHANGHTNASANGIETWIFGQPLSQTNLDRAIEENGGQRLTDTALELANDPFVMILRETQLRYSRLLAESVQANLLNTTGAVDRGIQTSALYVIANARTPSILVEVGFVSNPDEGRRLNDASYQEQLARGIATGITEFLAGDSGR